MANQKVRKTKPSLKQQEDEDSEGKGGMFLEKEDVQLILNALRRYKPTEKEEHLHGILLRSLRKYLCAITKRYSLSNKSTAGDIDPDEIE